MSIFKVWVERSDITRELFAVETETLEEAKDKAESGDVDPMHTLHIYGEVLDSWEDVSR